MCYNEFFARFYHNNNGSVCPLTTKHFKSQRKSAKKHNFHTCCPLTKKRVCYCRFSDSKRENDLNEFLDRLLNDEIDLDVSGKYLKIKRNQNYVKKKKEEEDMQSLIYEQMKTTNFNEFTNKYSIKLDDKILKLKDYKNIEKKMKEDKQVCVQCGGELHEGTFKNNEKGQSTLCATCMKKFYAGANEVRYDQKINLDPHLNSNLVVGVNGYNSINNKLPGNYLTDFKGSAMHNGKTFNGNVVFNGVNNNAIINNANNDSAAQTKFVSFKVVK